MSDISLDSVQWGPTLLLNLSRSAAAGLVWFIVRLLIGDPLSESASMLLLPGVYFVVLLPLGLIAISLSKAGVPFVSFFTLMAALSIVVGDPVLFLVSLIKPDILPVPNYPPLNFKLIMLVSD